MHNSGEHGWTILNIDEYQNEIEIEIENVNRKTVSVHMNVNRISKKEWQYHKTAQN